MNRMPRENAMQDKAPTLGFIGLGVMGGPMCCNVVRKHAAPVHAFDMSAEAVEDVRKAGGLAATSVGDMAKAADIVFLSLPGGKQVHEVCLGKGGLASAGKSGMVVVDLSTTSVADARFVSEKLAEKRLLFADAPVARTRQAARDGTLSIMVGASDELFARIEPLLSYMGSDVTLCGGVGCGQVVKLINNTLVFEHVAALAEMMVVAERAGVSRKTLASAVSKGSGDSFVLRNHGVKAMVPGVFPEKAFPSSYVLKDLGYAIELAESMGIDPRLPRSIEKYYRDAIAQGLGEKYFPTIIDVIGES
jgi:3-hydroxyisobutyrate dehydrogenase-like beta-hydroxyacid dehydrogenase